MLLVVYCEQSGYHGAPLCWFRRMTGIPCPTCGGIRSVLDWLRGDWQMAMVRNPLLFTAQACLAAWSLLRFGCGKRLVLDLQPSQKVWAWGVLVVAIAANWAYVIAQH